MTRLCFALVLVALCWTAAYANEAHRQWYEAAYAQCLKGHAPLDRPCVKGHD